MEGLVSLVLFAGLFYFMMRFGCGAHMVHGHGGHEEYGGEPHGRMPAESSSIDPVCGVSVTPDQGYTTMYHGRRYRLCSRACLETFEAGPQPYAA
jgi:YHS domain-containing protein